MRIQFSSLHFCRRLLGIAEIPESCPMLMSQNVLKKWDVGMCFGKGHMRVRKFKLATPFNEHEILGANLLGMTKEQV